MTEIVTIKEFQQALTFQSPIPVSWAVRQYASLITTIESQNSQIESLKAITELAVKQLQTEMGYAVATGMNLSASRILNVLKEIERLQNA